MDEMNNKLLLSDLRTCNVVSVDNTSFKEFSEQLRDRFEKFGEEFRRIGYVSCNRLEEVLNDVFEIERPNTIYGNEQGILFIDEKAFDYTFTGSDGLIEKMEPTEPVYDISWIRKRMKCCKNPMERKQLEKQLNAAYKARKKARKNK